MPVVAGRTPADDKDAIMTTARNGSQLIADLMANYGVTHVFFVPTILNHTLYEMEVRTEIARLVTHSEKAAAYMADGYARASGRVGVCMAQMVGAGNLAAGLRDGALASSPMIAITGGPYDYSRGRFQYQELDDTPAFAPYTKDQIFVSRLDQLAPSLRQAFRVATTGQPGAVHVQLEGHWGEVVERQEGAVDTFAEGQFSQAPAFRPAPEAGAVAAAAQLLARAERPVIVAGGGVVRSGARAELLALAEALSIPVASSLTGKDVIPAGHPLHAGVAGLYSRQSANDIVSRADLVFFIGTKAGSQPTLNWQVPAQGTTVIQADIDGTITGLNYPNAASLVGDAKATLLALTEELDGVTATDRSAWLQETATITEDWYRSQYQYRTADAIPMRPERLCADLSDALPDNAIVVVDTGHSGVWGASHIDLRSPDQRFLRAAGSLGWALPASIGAQCAMPDRPVVCFTGDGGIWYHLSELETAARWNIPITVVVNNNHGFNQEIPLWKAAYQGELTGNHSQMWRFRPTNFARLATEMGVPSIRVEDPSDLSAALKESIATDGPTLVEAVTDVWATAPKPTKPPA
jgi:acetolactate synthase-1/2/3 large subunit